MLLVIVLVWVCVVFLFWFVYRQQVSWVLFFAGLTCSCYFSGFVILVFGFCVVLVFGLLRCFRYVLVVLFSLVLVVWWFVVIHGGLGCTRVF